MDRWASAGNDLYFFCGTQGIEVWMEDIPNLVWSDCILEKLFIWDREHVQLTYQHWGKIVHIASVQFLCWLMEKKDKILSAHNH